MNMARAYNGIKTVSSINGVGKIGEVHTKKLKEFVITKPLYEMLKGLI